MTKAERIGREGADPFFFGMDRPVPLTLESMAGLWTLRFGLFGCRDEETEGGICHIEEDRLASADGYFLLHGRFTVRDGGIEVAAQTIRHRSGSPFDAIYDHPDAIFPITFRAEAISLDQLEGRIQQPGYPDMRIVMRRFRTLGPQSLLV
jgi:hypothetical protein